VHVEGGRTLTGIAVVVLIVGLLVTAALTVTSRIVYNHNENRLLLARMRELALVLTSAVPQIQTPLASADAFADATGGDTAKFRAFMAPSVGPGRQFVSAALLPLGVAHPRPKAVLGSTPALLSRPAQLDAFVAQTTRGAGLNVVGLLGGKAPRLGYAFLAAGARHGFVVYAEGALPKDRRSRLSSNSAFFGLHYALFLGHSKQSRQLLVTDLAHLPVSGRQVSTTVRFGRTVLTLIVTAGGPLGGAFSELLPWFIAVVGAVLALAAALLVERLMRGRRHAEQLAGVLDRVAEENRRMYAEQRSIAQTLQHALLPEELPALRGLESSARYVPASSGIDVGGDWYDIIPAEGDRALLVVGDVAGHGLRAATTMASLRHATVAFATEDCRPSAVLAKLSRFASRHDYDYFATVLCVLIEVGERRISVASAGHLAPLVIDEHGCRFAEIRVGMPVGVAHEELYEEATTVLAPHATLLAFTDGLVERRGEVIDVGLERLREAALGAERSLDELVGTLARDLAPDGHHDDTAIIAVRWNG
jgi:serine phosphatase RsbU (regulator of sigma subunit)